MVSNHADETACLRCGASAGYNRGVVDRVSGAFVGDFCRNCELESFGRCLEAGFWKPDDCGFCDRDGLLAVPRYRTTASEESPGDLRCSTDLEALDESLSLCDEHAHRLFEGDADSGAAGDGSQVPERS